MSIIQRGGVYYADYVNGSGERVRCSLKTRDRKQAEEKHDTLKAASWRQSQLSEKPRRSWKEAAVRFLNETQHKRSRESDISRFRWLDSWMGNLYLDQIDHDLIQRLVEIRSATVKPATINQDLALIRTIIKRAVREWSWLDREVHVKMLPMNNARDRVLSESEEVRLLQALPEHLKDIVRLALATGLRKGNLIGLRWEWVSFERQTLTIPASEMKNNVALGIPLTSTTLAILRRQRGKHPDFVFSYKGNRLTSLANATWQLACKRADIKDLTVHDLRRSWATRMAIQGVPIDAILRLGGWNNYAMLLKRYAHLQPEHLREAAEMASKPLVSTARSG